MLQSSHVLTRHPCPVHLPTPRRFHLWLGGEIVQSFSANVTTVATLRAEIANFKPCSDPGCEMY